MPVAETACDTSKNQKLNKNLINAMWRYLRQPPSAWLHKTAGLGAKGRQLHGPPSRIIRRHGTLAVHCADFNPQATPVVERHSLRAHTFLIQGRLLPTG